MTRVNPGKEYWSRLGFSWMTLYHCLSFSVIALSYLSVFWICIHKPFLVLFSIFFSIFSSIWMWHNFWLAERYGLANQKLCFIQIYKILDNWLIEWCFMPLSTVFQSYHGNSSHYSCLSWVSSVLGWGSEVSCPRTLPLKLRRSGTARTQNPWIMSLRQKDKECS